jgi:hypothetical protein
VVLDRVRKLLASPEPGPPPSGNGEDEIIARKVTALLADFATLWNELFPVEQVRMCGLLRDNRHNEIDDGYAGAFDQVCLSMR